MQQKNEKYQLVEIVGASSPNVILHADCQQACAYLRDNERSIDMVYIDPPFASSSAYKRPVYMRPPSGQHIETKLSPAWQQTVFEDTLTPQMFLDWIEPNLRTIYDVLSPNGVLFLHLDHHISHYVKVMLDSIFGADNFRNEIIWGYRTGGISKRTFAQKHDTIFFYSKGPKYKFNPQYYRSYQAKRYNYNAKYPELWDEEAKRWYHLAVCRDIWEDINVLGTERDGSERLDYPTQKPEALMERLIAATTDVNDTVADFFGGSGVCANTAYKMGRSFIHSDISPISVQTCRDRLKNEGASFQLLHAPLLDQLDERAEKSSNAIDIKATLLAAPELRPQDQLTLDDITAPANPYSIRIDNYYSSDAQQAWDKENERRLRRKLAPLTPITNGNEFIAWISADCERPNGYWHSSCECHIGARGHSWNSQDSSNCKKSWDGELICPTRPYRLKVRDILGTETIIAID